MKYSTFPKQTGDHTKEPIFFGNNVNVARYDRVKYPFIDSLSERQLAFFWRPQEIDVSRDRQDFLQKLDAAQQHIFISNLKYQTLLDSVQGRSLLVSLLKVVSIPEMENWVETWGFSETIHSRSYTHIIRNLLPDPGIVFDDIVNNKYVADRADSVTALYDKFIMMSEYYVIHRDYIDTLSVDTEVEVLCSATTTGRVAGTGVSTDLGVFSSDSIRFTKRKLMETLFLLLIDIYALEAIRFFVSFACSFAFSERGLMEGNAKIIRLICRDEMLHKEGAAYVINLLRSGREGALWKEIADSCISRVPAVFNTIAKQESEWGEYLFKDGSMIGLNHSILDQYVRFRGYESMAQIGVSRKDMALEGFTTYVDPLPWMKYYVESDEVQVAPQEAELSNYLTADVNNDLGSDLNIQIVM